MSENGLIMGILEAMLLGLLQGLTEFLPVSSSGHLVVAQSLIPNFKQPGVLFDALLHMGTLLAVVVFYKKEFSLILSSLLPGGSSWGNKKRTEGRRLLYLIILGSIPTAIIGFLFKTQVEEMFLRPKLVGYMLLITGAILALSDRVEAKGKGLPGMRDWKAIVIGIFQGIAVIPGISRSGVTIASGIMLGLKRDFAMEYSFILAVPAVFGAVTLEAVRHLPSFVNDVNLAAYILGMCVAGFVGYLTIGWLLRLVQMKRLAYFGIYCFIIGMLVVFVL